jgi:hypothetical protein
MKPYAVLLLILLLAASVLLLGAQNEDDGSSRLVGTWVVNVTANPVSICGGPQVAPAGQRKRWAWRVAGPGWELQDQLPQPAL